MGIFNMASISIREAQVISSKSAAPTNIMSADNIPTSTLNNNAQSLNASIGGQVAQNLQANTPQSTSQSTNYSNSTTYKSQITQQLNAAGVQFNPQQNPLNDYSNYTYHIRLSLLNETSSYAQDGTYAKMNAATKFIIAESGVTAGFNISEFEYKNVCSPNNKTLNTTSTTWTMTILEPYGMSMIDKMFTAGNNIGVCNWNRAPYMLEIWFDGYNEDGTFMLPTLFYTLYRVTLLDINVKVTEGGSVYNVSGIFDGDIGHSNEISIPAANFQVSSLTVGDFFTQFQNALNTSKPNNVNENQQSPLTHYIFNVPPSIAQWTFKPADFDTVSQRMIDMTAETTANGSTSFSIGMGVSMENIVNMVIGTCMQAKDWIQADPTSNSNSLMTETGISTWILLHSFVQVLLPFNTNVNDYNRNIVYNLVPYNSVIGVTDKASVENLSQPLTQLKKLNQLATTNNALAKEYDYIYTGLNTEVISFDISIDNAWQIAIPQWSALNSYYNVMAPPKVNTSTPGYAYWTGVYNTSSNPSSAPSNPTNLDGTTGTQYIEDLSVDFTQFPFIIPVRQQNLPNAQLAENSTDTSPAAGNDKSDGKTAPMSRSLAGTYLQNLFGNAPSFLNIELEIRGDPYWMGSGNVVDDTYTVTKLIPNATNLPSTTPPNDVRANFIASSTMFILSFRTGENYNENTGLMQFDGASQFYNGAYVVTEVTNSFKQGSFTQTLSAYKDPLAQLATVQQYPNGGVGRQV